MPLIKRNILRIILLDLIIIILYFYIQLHEIMWMINKKMKLWLLIMF